MISKINEPYVKRYENGVLANPINGSYRSEWPNRRQRRSKMERFINNRKTCHLSVLPGEKFHRVVQMVDGKRIEHYIKRERKS